MVKKNKFVVEANLSKRVNSDAMKRLAYNRLFEMALWFRNRFWKRSLDILFLLSLDESEDTILIDHKYRLGEIREEYNEDEEPVLCLPVYHRDSMFDNLNMFMEIKNAIQDVREIMDGENRSSYEWCSVSIRPNGEVFIKINERLYYSLIAADHKIERGK